MKLAIGAVLFATVIATNLPPAHAFQCGMECQTWSYGKNPPGSLSEAARKAEIARCRAARDKDCKKKQSASR